MSASRGSLETAKLKTNMEEQLHRLLSQLEDLKEMKDSLEKDEYDEMYKDTIQQLKEFQDSLKKMMDGNMTLVDELSSVKLAIQAAVSEAFSTPAVISMFAKKEPTQLRAKLVDIKRDVKLGKVSREVGTQECLEILIALKKLGEELAEDELAFLTSNMSKNMADFEKDDDVLNNSQQSNIMSKAKTDMNK